VCLLDSEASPGYSPRVNAPPTRSSSWHLTLAALLVGVVTVAALLPSTNVRWSADDAYVLEHLQSADLRSRLFAFNLDRPSDSSGAWWEGIVYQRRFVRIVPSALMSLEVRLLGRDPWRLHLVSLALHLLNTLLIFHLSRRWLGHAGTGSRARRQPRRGPGSGGADAARVPTERALANTDLALPVIVTGSFDPVLERAGCNYDVSLTWPGRQQLNLVPPSVSGATPRLVRTGERSFLAEADARGFAIASERVATPANRGRYSGGGTRFRAVPPQLLTDGTQQVGEARLEVTERVGALITGIGYTLDKPLEQYAFLAVDGCAKVRAHRPE